MLSILSAFIAGLLFLCAGFNQDIFSQGTIDEIAFGLFFLVLAWLLAPFGPPAPWVRRV